MICKIGKTWFGQDEFDCFLLCGTASRDGEVKETKNGKAMGKVGVVAGKSSNGETQFIDVVGFGNKSAMIASIHKGDGVLAVGRMDKNEYNGRTYYSIVSDYVSCDALPSGAAFAQKPFPNDAADSLPAFQEVSESGEDDLPF